MALRSLLLGARHDPGAVPCGALALTPILFHHLHNQGSSNTARPTMSSTLTVRPVQPEDYAAWRPLWDGYNAFYGRFGAIRSLFPARMREPRCTTCASN